MSVLKTRVFISPTAELGRGFENQGALMTRGVLIDVAALKGVQILPDIYVVTREDLQQVLAKENMKL
jgi:hypothetical protein